jgi:predicted DNA-binding ribbon-helix-helix protein
VLVGGHRTSISLEPEFRREFWRICKKLGEPLGSAVTRIDRQRRPGQSLSSAIRVYVLEQVRADARRK